MDRLDAWIHRSFPVSASGLAAYRIFYASFVLLFESPGHDLYTNLGPATSFPDAFFLPPPGPMVLFGGFPGTITAAIVHLLLNVSLAAVLFGYRTRFFSLLTAFLLLIIYGFSYSFGKIVHNFLFAVVPIAMAFSNWGAAFSYDSLVGRMSRRRPESWPLTLLALLLGFGMFTAGFAKILGGWLSWESQAVFGHLVKQVFVRDRSALLALHALHLDSRFLWEVLDYLTVVFEVGFLAAVVRPGLFRWFAGLAVLFHFGVMLTLNIAFAFNLALYAAFIDWRRIAAAGRHIRIRRDVFRVSVGRLKAPFLVGSIAGVGLFFDLVGSPLIWLDGFIELDSDLTPKEVLLLTTSAILVIGALLHTFISQIRRWNSRSEPRAHSSVR